MEVIPLLETKLSQYESEVVHWTQKAEEFATAGRKVFEEANRKGAKLLEKELAAKASASKASREADRVRQLLGGLKRTIEEDR